MTRRILVPTALPTALRTSLPIDALIENAKTFVILELHWWNAPILLHLRFLQLKVDPLVTTVSTVLHDPALPLPSKLCSTLESGRQQCYMLIGTLRHRTRAARALVLRPVSKLARPAAVMSGKTLATGVQLDAARMAGRAVQRSRDRERVRSIRRRCYREHIALT